MDRVRRIIAIVLLLLTGCAPKNPPGTHVLFIVPGAGGAWGYESLARAMQKPQRTVQLVTWGAPPPLFMLNFSSQSIHDAAERKLAGRIERWRSEHPGGRIDLMGHSAGCGVVLGAIARLETARVTNVVLLEPSVSPTYDLTAALAKMDGQLHVFYSDRDRLFLSWRTNTFGTYDRIRTPAAGHVGFAATQPHARLVQHAYDPQWRSVGNDGGHFGTLRTKFAHQVLRPLLE
jgi:pimeloyl-ACP methyl ester carboxylesterase